MEGVEGLEAEESSAKPFPRLRFALLFPRSISSYLARIFQTESNP